MIKKIRRTRLFYGLISLIFTYINYSHFSWSFFFKLGGLALAKVGPEVIGIIFFLILAKVYISEFYPGFRIKIEKKEILTFIFFALVIFIFRYKQFSTYFYRDDFYLVLNRPGTAYSLYGWGSWLSSFSLSMWELTRLISGFSAWGYRIISLLSHLLLSIGVYYLAKYLSRKYIVGFISALLILTTTISFEAFNWFIHPISFAWQGFFVCISVISLIWEIEKNKGKTTPYISFFFLMPAFFSGVSRIGFVLPFISVVDFLVSFKFFKIKKFSEWVKGFVSRQWIFYLSAIIFVTIRSLWLVGTRTEVFTASMYKVYLYIIGIFSLPVEMYILLSKLTSSLIPPGIITVYFGLFFLILFFIAVIITKIKKKKIPLIVSVGFFWVVLSALYFAMYGPHLPSTDNQIDFSTKTHHLAYISSIGALMVWAYFICIAIRFLQKTKKPYKTIFPTLLVGVLVLVNYYWLSKQYDNFLNIPKGLKITRQEFFFETYKKYIPRDAKKVYIYYDDGYLSRKDNYKPLDGYFWALWNPEGIKILAGDEELETYFMSFTGKSSEKDGVESLYSIYTDYDNGLIEDDLSQMLRDNIIRPVSKILETDTLKPVWGRQNGNVFSPDVIRDKAIGLNYFKNPVISVNDLDFPAVLTPRLNMKLYVTPVGNQSSFIDLRAGILSDILTNHRLPNDSHLLSLADYYNTNTSKSLSNFLDVINTPTVIDKMVCEKTPGEEGITFLISWVGEPDSYYSQLSSEDKNNIFSTKYNQRFYSLCYFSQVQGIKNISLDLSNTGSIIRGLVVVPLTREPVSIQLFESNIKSPQILK